MKDSVKVVVFGIMLFIVLFISSRNSEASISGNCDCYTYSSCPYGNFVGYTGSCWGSSPEKKCCYNYPGSSVASECYTGISSAPSCPPPPPPPETCGNGVCRSGETCSSCSTDCGRCKPTLSEWCGNNCVAANTRPDSTYNNCGEGWTGWSTMWCHTPPPGETCGTCIGAALCGDSKITSPETCDDGNKVTESCTYGQTSCTVCDSTCKSVAGATSYCGDSIKNGDEGCDDGNKNNADGCSSTCAVELGYTCNNNQPNVCGRNIDTCFDGLDNNANGQVDENCGGCADLNNDTKLNFNDFFILADCTYGTSTCSGGAAVLSMVDWNDNGLADTSAPNVQAARSDFNKDGVVNIQDMFIIADEWDKTGTNLKSDIDKDGKVDYDDWFMFMDDVGKDLSLGRDLKCFMQQWVLYGGKTIPACGQQQCEFSKTWPNTPNTCKGSIYCADNNAVCSFGKTGKTNLNDFTVISDKIGVCCLSGRYWNGNSCVQASENPLCTCSYNIASSSFWKDPNCLNINQHLACLKTTLFSKSQEQRKLEIVRRG